MRLIDADALIEEALTNVTYGYVDALQIAIAPTVDAVPIRHGRWLYHTLIDGHTHAECSECHKIRIIDNFCPNCGARMDGGDGNDDAE